MSKPLQSLFALLSITLFLTTCYADGSNTSKLCAPSDCGNVSIRYPFWTRSNTMPAGEFCGYPDFGIECSAGEAIMTLPSDTYYVKDINYDENSITLIDIDVVNQTCPRAKHNVSIANLPLTFSSLDLNLSFYFNCSGNPGNLDPIGCLRHGSNDSRESYVFVKGDEAENGFDWAKHCVEHVVVTVKGDEIDVVGGGLITGFGAAMQNGFVLDWIRAEDCAECELSGGFCGYDQTTKKSLCMCRNGSVAAKTCKKGTLVLTCSKLPRIFLSSP